MIMKFVKPLFKFRFFLNNVYDEDYSYWVNFGFKSSYNTWEKTFYFELSFGVWELSLTNDHDTITYFEDDKEYKNRKKLAASGSLN